MKALQMRKNLTRGYLFTFCGLDGCGKTTMIQRLGGGLAEAAGKAGAAYTPAYGCSEKFCNFSDVYGPARS